MDKFDYFFEGQSYMYIQKVKETRTELPSYRKPLKNKT